MDTILHAIKSIEPGPAIPKPKATKEFILKGWGIRRGHEALIYYIPNHKNPDKPYEKGINIIEFEKALILLLSNGDFSREWFNTNMQSCASEGPCNYTTIGGVFEMLGLAFYQRAVYK